MRRIARRSLALSAAVLFAGVLAGTGTPASAVQEIPDQFRACQDVVECVLPFNAPGGKFDYRIMVSAHGGPVHMQVSGTNCTDYLPGNLTDVTGSCTLDPGAYSMRVWDPANQRHGYRITVFA